MTRPRVLAILATLAALPAHASSPAAQAAQNRAATAACLKAADLNAAKVGPAALFSDDVGMDARIVTGTWRPRHMRGAKATMLCLYDRRSGRAEAQELPARP